jgi:hypothetical protein
MTVRAGARRVRLNIWLAIDVTLALSAVRLHPGLMKPATDFCAMFTAAPVVEWVMNGLFLWLLVLLWLAHKEWFRGLVGGRALASPSA